MKLVVVGKIAIKELIGKRIQELRKAHRLNPSECNAQADKTTTLSEDLTDYQKSCRKRWANYLPLPLLTKEGTKGML